MVSLALVMAQAAAQAVAQVAQAQAQAMSEVQEAQVVALVRERLALR